MPLRIANAAGFLGDQLDAPRRLLESAEVDYLTLEYLAELTLSILARQREKDPTRGYAEDFLDVLREIIPALQRQPQVRIVTNAGGVNPADCARQAARVLVEAGMADVLLGVVTGDELLHRLQEIQQAGCPLTNLETGQPLRDLAASVVSANAYLGARPITMALANKSRIVITGRVADASLTLGPVMHEFGWAWDDWDRLAAASVAGHLIECGAQVTGGYSGRWKMLDLANVGYPIAEIDEQAGVTITKPIGSGGVVDRHSVIEQLVYEIGDPRHYITPDVEVDFTDVEVEQVAENVVRASGARGQKPPDSYKVSLAYHAGYQASGQLVVYGDDCRPKALACAEIVEQRLAQAGYRYQQLCVELLGGTGGAVCSLPGPADAALQSDREVVLRITVQDDRREAVERFTREFAPLVTTGPAGLAGYTSARGTVRPVYAYWPTIVPKALVESAVRVARADEWVQE